MNNVLLLNASIFGENGNSSTLTEQFIAKLSAKTEVNLTTRNLGTEPLPHLSAVEMQAWMTAVEERSDEQNASAELSDKLVEELKANDLIVIGMPMYNFAIPSNFKVWIDRVARAGVTFKYTETGPVGLLENKKVLIFAARGGAYVGTPKDTQSQYLKDILAFIGISDVEFIYAEGLNMGLKDEAFSQAEQRIDALVEAF